MQWLKPSKISSSYVLNGLLKFLNFQLIFLELFDFDFIELLLLALIFKQKQLNFIIDRKVQVIPLFDSFEVLAVMNSDAI